MAEGPPSSSSWPGQVISVFLLKIRPVGATDKNRAVLHNNLFGVVNNKKCDNFHPKQHNLRKFNSECSNLREHRRASNLMKAGALLKLAANHGDPHGQGRAPVAEVLSDAAEEGLCCAGSAAGRVGCRCPGSQPAPSPPPPPVAVLTPNFLSQCRAFEMTMHALRQAARLATALSGTAVVDSAGGMQPQPVEISLASGQ
jgi:hypothetical protein